MFNAKVFGATAHAARLLQPASEGANEDLKLFMQDLFRLQNEARAAKNLAPYKHSRALSLANKERVEMTGSFEDAKYGSGGVINENSAKHLPDGVSAQDVINKLIEEGSGEIYERVFSATDVHAGVWCNKGESVKDCSLSYAGTEWTPKQDYENCEGDELSFVGSATCETVMPEEAESTEAADESNDEESSPSTEEPVSEEPVVDENVDVVPAEAAEESNDEESSPSTEEPVSSTEESDVDENVDDLPAETTEESNDEEALPTEDPVSTEDPVADENVDVVPAEAEESNDEALPTEDPVSSTDAPETEESNDEEALTATEQPESTETVEAVAPVEEANDESVPSTEEPSEAITVVPAASEAAEESNDEEFEPVEPVFGTGILPSGATDADALFDALAENGNDSEEATSEVVTTTTEPTNTDADDEESDADVSGDGEETEADAMIDASAMHGDTPLPNGTFIQPAALTVSSSFNFSVCLFLVL